MQMEDEEDRPYTAESVNAAKELLQSSRVSREHAASLCMLGAALCIYTCMLRTLLASAVLAFCR